MKEDTLFAAALSQALDPVLITDADLVAPGPRILYVNTAFCQMTGYSAGELVGKSPRILQGPSTDRAVLDALRTRLTAGEPFIGNTVNYRKDRTPLDMQWRASPILSPDGQVTHYLSLHRDLSADRQTHEKIEHYVSRVLAEKAKLDAKNRELEASNAHLLSLATTDGLTGLKNHRHFHQELSRTRGSHEVVSLAMLDVDHFKSFNDTFGHSAGDAVLQAVAEAIKGCVRADDTVARYGGEEFAILLPGQSDDQALSVAERVRAAVESVPMMQRSITISIGIATGKAGRGADQALLDDADEALYAAKASGRNRVRHHRHLHQQPLNITPCKDVCAPTPNGCAKCETMPASKTPEGAALLFGPHDLDADNTLRKALNSNGFAFVEMGPVLIVGNVAGRLAEVGTLLKEELSSYTRSCIQAAYIPSGISTANQAMSALMFAKPLNEMIETIEHEWVREALGQNWLFSVFHPIVDARTGIPFAQEALLRARNGPAGKIIGAGQIIDACAKLNLEHQLDQRARQAAIRGAAQHVLADQHVFINFLPNTIYDPEICLRTTMEAAAEHNLPMSRLVFEVVETEKIPDMGHLLHVLDYYRSRGMGTAVDDMGAGFTGVDYIAALKPDFVKLDRDLVLEAEKHPDGLRKMQTMIDACRTHGAKIIAEGIETPAQMKMCVDAGVDLLQGFLFAKPACPPQAVNWPGAVAVRKAA